MDFDELRDTTMDPVKRSLLQITVEQAAIADEVCSILMGEDVPAAPPLHPDERTRRALPRHLADDGPPHDRATARQRRTEEPEVEGYIEPIEINLEMERSFLEYSMSVIVSRALPDVRDGLKPVHRRILYSMFDQGLRPDRPHAKCAKVVGEVMGTFHPHGDTAIYDALVRMAQDFAMRHPLIDGHGNFGGMGPDDGRRGDALHGVPARAASRCDLLEGIDEETVDFSPNYDNTDQQPDVLPARFPNLLVNGSQGIAVGMATKIPPHNLGEVVDATLHLLATPRRQLRRPHGVREGPRLPDGRPDPRTPGHPRRVPHRPRVRPACAPSPRSKRRGPTTQIIVTEFPYEVSVESIEVRISDLVKSGDLDGISKVQNDSAGRKTAAGDRRSSATRTRTSCSTSSTRTRRCRRPSRSTALALVDGVPRTLDLAQVLTHYLAHQVEVVTRRSQFRLRRAEARAHIVEGLLRAIDQLDAVIAAIRGSDDRASGARGAHGRAVLVLRGAGDAHPRHDARPPDAARACRARRGDGRSSERRSPSCRRSSRTTTKLRAVIAEEMTAVRDTLRRRSAHRDRERPRRARRSRTSSPTRRSSSR